VAEEAGEDGLLGDAAVADDLRLAEGLRGFGSGGEDAAGRLAADLRNGQRCDGGGEREDAGTLECSGDGTDSYGLPGSTASFRSDALR